jgi:transcriptional regulator with XRE-family HTH domain/predicted nucleotidyltransferase
METLGAAVARARQRLGLTKKALATAAGLSRLTIAQLEAGTVSDLGIRKVHRVLAALGLTMTVADRAARRAAGQRSAIAGGGGAAPSSQLGRLFAQRATERRRRALELAGRTLEALRRAGVSACIVGSLAKGRFRGDSDVDFLVEDRGGVPESRVLGIVEASMAGFPADVTFAERADARLLEMMRQEARRGAPAVRAA